MEVILLVEEIAVPGENHQPTASHYETGGIEINLPFSSTLIPIFSILLFLHQEIKQVHILLHRDPDLTC